MVFGIINGEVFFIQKFLMKIGGLWPLDGRKCGPLIAFAIYSAVQLTSTVLYFISACDEAPPDRYWNMLGSFQVFLTLLSACLLWKRKNQIAELIESTTDDWSNFTNRKELEIMKRHNGFGKSYFIADVMGKRTSDGFQAVHSLQEDLIFIKTKLWFDQDVMTIQCIPYVLRDAFTVVCVSLSLTEVGIMILWWSLTMHLSGQFKILQQRFRKFLRMNSKIESHKEFRRLVDRHNELLRLSNVLKETFSFYLGSTILFCHINICLQTVWTYLFFSSGYYVQMALEALPLAWLLWRQYMFHEASEYLTTCSEEIGDVFRQCKWYNLSKEERQNFSIVILQTERPVTLKACNIWRFNRENFLHLVQSQYSYLTFILTMIKKAYPEDKFNK